jgi:hypothetical protein
MVTKKHNTGYAPWKCSECGAWVFTLPNLHAPLCSEYKKCSAMVASTVRYYESLKLSEPTMLPVKRARKKRMS